MNCTYCGNHSPAGEYLCTTCAEGLEREFQEYMVEKSTIQDTDTSAYQDEEWDDSIPF